MVYILLGTGFEEIEAVAPGDLLRRAGVEVCYAALEGTTVTGSHGIRIQADYDLAGIRPEDLDMIVLPGGLRGVQSLLACEKALSLVREAWEAGKYVAAICAAPTILAKLGIVENRPAVCYPGMADQMGPAAMQDAPAVTCGRLITGRSAGAALDFALALISALKGEEAARKVAGGIVYTPVTFDFGR